MRWCLAPSLGRAASSPCSSLTAIPFLSLGGSGLSSTHTGARAGDTRDDCAILYPVAVALGAYLHKNGHRLRDQWNRLHALTREQARVERIARPGSA